MPGCVLRVESRSPDVERPVKASGLQPISIYRKGQPRVPGSSHLSRESGFNVDVSPANGGLDRQARDATPRHGRVGEGEHQSDRTAVCRPDQAISATEATRFRVELLEIPRLSEPRRSHGMAHLVSVVLLAAASSQRASADEARTPLFVAVSAGQDHTCALGADGTAYCWGANDAGQLGAGVADGGPHTVPERVRGGIAFRAIAAGHRHSCGLTADGRAFCWGYGGTGQLGQGALRDSATPVPVGGDLRFTSVSAGGTHTCAVTSAGKAYCWGGNWHGQLGNGSVAGDQDTPCCDKAPTPVAVDVAFRHVSAGGIHTCGVTEVGEAYCWGASQDGRLGSGNESSDRPTPVRAAVGVDFSAVSARGLNTCGISTRSDLYCWGRGQEGQLGILTPPPAADRPVRVETPVRFRAVSVGTYYVCALGGDRRVYCWGANRYGQLGDGSREPRLVPRATVGRNRYRFVSAGGNEFSGHACALTVDGAVFCWGDNRRGQLGDGSTSDRPVPVPIAIATARRLQPATSR